MLTSPQLEQIQALLIQAWETSPNHDEFEGYWYLRGYLHRYCEEQHIDEDEIYDQLGSFLINLSAFHEEEETEEDDEQ